MTKTIGMLLVVVTLLTGVVALGDIDLYWASTGGFFQSDGTTPLLNVMGMSALVQLIQVGPDGLISPATNNPALNYVGGDDILVAQIVFTNPGNDGFNEYAAVQYGRVQAAYSNYFFYGRIFQDATPGALEYYFNGHVTNTMNVGEGAWQEYDFNNGNLAGDRIDQNQLPDVIPEPSTLALAGIGLMALVVRAIRRK